MATLREFKELTSGCGLESDCPVCGYSWPGCQGACVAHETRTGQYGPYHNDYNDDCVECADAQQGYLDTDALLKTGLSRRTIEAITDGFRSIAFNRGVQHRLAEEDTDTSYPCYPRREKVMKPAEVEELWHVYQKVKRLFLKRLSDQQPHTLAELRSLVPEELTTARERLSPSWIARDHPSRKETMHATYGILLTRDVSNWLIDHGTCVWHNADGVEKIQLAQTPATTPSREEKA